MADTNFFSYMFSRAGSVAFDELSEAVDLSNPESIQAAFVSYLEDYPPPADIKGDLLEEKFYKSPEEGDGGDETYIRYDMAIPGMKEDVDPGEVSVYLENFLEKIGAENGAGNGCGVEVTSGGDERGGIDLDIYVFIKGKQISEKAK